MLQPARALLHGFDLVQKFCIISLQHIDSLFQSRVGLACAIGRKKASFPKQHDTDRDEKEAYKDIP